MDFIIFTFLISVFCVIVFIFYYLFLFLLLCVIDSVSWTETDNRYCKGVGSWHSLFLFKNHFRTSNFKFDFFSHAAPDSNFCFFFSSSSFYLTKINGLFIELYSNRIFVRIYFFVHIIIFPIIFPSFLLFFKKKTNTT